MSEKLTLQNITEVYESTRKYQHATLKDGAEIRYFNKFSNSKIKKLMEELHDTIKEDEQQPIKYFTSDGRFYDFIYFLIIKHFTDFGQEFPDGYEESIRVFSMLVELELFTEILENVLPINEVGRVLEEIVHRAQLVEQFAKLDKK